MRRGEVLSRVGASRPFSWRPAPTAEERGGKVFPARRAGSEGTLYVFESDVNRNVGVPPVSWFCDLLHNPSLNSVPCRNGLFRLRISPRRFAAYMPCIQSRCPLVVIGEKSRHLSYIQNLQDVRLVELGKRTLALATHRWTTDAAWTGTDVVVFEVAPSFRRLAEITVEETDARGEIVRAIRGRLEPRTSGLMLEGESIQFERTSAKRRSSERLLMSWGMTSEGRFVRSE